MLARHSIELLSKLERVADIGCAEITNNQLLLWYDQERITVGIWRDIHDKWMEVLEAHGEDTDLPLLAGEADGVWVFAWGEGLVESPKSWFKEVSSLSKRKPAETLETA
jgi:hypothetical protein